MSKQKKLIGVLIAVILLTGCSNKPMQSGSAAMIGDHVIKQSVVTDQLIELKNQLENSPQQQNMPSASELSQLIVNRLISTDLLSQAVSELKIKITDAEVVKLEEAIYAQYGKDAVIQQLAAKQAVPLSELDSFFKLVLSQNYIGTTLVPKGSTQQQAAAAANYLTNLANRSEITVSPRYGTWNPSQMLVSGADNTLSFSSTGAQ